MGDGVNGRVAPFSACVLVPVFDNAKTVGSVVREACSLGLPVLVVDDGSRDGSGDLAAKEGALLVRHPVNQGKGAALKTGWREALARGFTHAVSIDADGQHFPEDIPKLVEVARANPDALVVGAREFAGQVHVQGKSSFGRAFSNFWVFFETGVQVEDTQCGLRVYPLAHVTRLDFRCDRFDLEVEVIVRAAWAGVPVLSSPVRVYYPPPAERISHFDVLRDNVRISWLNTKLVARRFFPWPHRRLVSAPRKSARERLHELARESSSPAMLGVAVGVGCVCGSSPFFGFHAPIAFLLASALRLNRLAAVLGTLVSTPPFSLPLAGASIAVGSFLLGGAPRPWPDHVDRALMWALLREWTLGGVIVGSLVGLVLGTLTYLVVSRRRAVSAAPA